MVTEYKFNGKELDSETGMYYYGARYYIPELSIWGSVDPLSDKYPSMSPFMYCAGNPVRLVKMLLSLGTFFNIKLKHQILHIIMGNLLCLHIQTDNDETC